MEDKAGPRKTMRAGRSPLRVTVDPDLCVGTGDCWRLAPSAFRLDEARGVSVVRARAPTTDRDILAEAAFNCPTKAITVSEEGS